MTRAVLPVGAGRRPEQRLQALWDRAVPVVLPAGATPSAVAVANEVQAWQSRQRSHWLAAIAGLRTCQTLPALTAWASQAVAVSWCFGRVHRLTCTLIELSAWRLGSTLTTVAAAVRAGVAGAPGTPVVVARRPRTPARTGSFAQVPTASQEDQPWKRPSIV